MMDYFKEKFKPEHHKNVLRHILKRVPSSLATLDANRIVVAYFALNGLDILGALPTDLPDDDPLRPEKIINWVYHLLVINDREFTSGFQLSSCVNTLDSRGKNCPYKWGYLAGTYAALSILLTLQDDFGKIKRKSITNSLKALQLRNGCFTAAINGTESDMRFVFCAAAVSYILDDWSGIDIELMVQFILHSISYDYGIGQGPGLESHSGSTYCAVAALTLSGQLHRLSSSQKNGLIRWLVYRLEGGFTGRPNKPIDSCYSFWTGAALKMLGVYDLVHRPENKEFVLQCQGRRGGFSKWPHCEPDPLHTYLAMAGLSFMGQTGIENVCPELNISLRAHNHLKRLHEKWRKESPYEKDICVMLDVGCSVKD